MGSATMSTVLLMSKGQYGKQAFRTFQELAEDKAATSKLEEIQCHIPPSVRSTFLMAFSPDSTKVASTHGDHKIYVCDVRNGKLLYVLEGHPRTPWCLAFHPSSNDILASGCLGGEVRVWDLHGGSEVWVAEQKSVITSLAFHPTDKVLVIATLNEIHFWDWSLPAPFTTCKTASDKEKVRFVKFDPMGVRLITGITNLPPENQRNQMLDSIFGHTFPRSAPSRSIQSQRRSILSRLMSMYRHLEGLEEISRYTNNGSRSTSPTHEDVLQRARQYAEEVTTQSTQWHRQRIYNLDQVLGVRDQYDSIEQQGSSSDPPSLLVDEPDPDIPLTIPTGPPLSDSNNNTNADFWMTFHRLRFICSSLERRMQQQPSPQVACFRIQQPQPSTSAASVDGSMPSISSDGASTSTSLPPIPDVREAGSDVSLSLVNLLTRLQHSLQSLSNAALTTAVAREQIQQVRTRIAEILERLANVSGYHARLTNLRDQIYEDSRSLVGLINPAADRMAQRGEDNTPTQRWDLAYCLWLVEMSLQLTRQMQRILAADYRLTQLHLTTAMPPSPSEFGMGSSDSAFRRHTSREHSPESRGPRPSLHNPFVSADSHSWHNRETSPFFWRRQSIGTQSDIPDHPSESQHDISQPGPSSAFGRLSGVRHEQHYPAHDGPSTSGFSRNRISGNNSVGTETSSPQQSHTQFDESEQRASAATSSRPPPLNPSLTRQSRYLTNRRRLFSYRMSPFNRERRRWPRLGGSQFGNVPDPSDSSSDDSTDQEQGSAAGWDLPTSAPESGRPRRPFVFPSVQIDPPSSPPPQDGVPIPPEERPRSPPLSAILSGAEHNTIGRVPASYLNILYDSSFRPRARPMFGYEAPHNLTHRIQCWNFAKYEIPSIADVESSVVVPKCKIHNDASVDISRDGELLAALVPNAGGLTQLVMLAIYSLRPQALGQCLYTWSFGPNPISVSLSPMGHYVVVGLASSRLHLGASEKETVAQIFRLDPCTKSSSLTYVSSVNQDGATQQSQISLNSVRWLPQSGQGLVYGTNRGSLCICRPLASGNEKASESAGSKVRRICNVQICVNRRPVLPLLSTATQTIQPDTQTTGTQTTEND